MQPPINYGLISRSDADTIERVLDTLIWNRRDEGKLYITEIGLFDCGTAKGIYKYVTLHDAGVEYTGIDSQKDKPITPPEWMTFLNGNSTEQYHRIPDNSQDFIFVDGCHTFAAVVADFFCYAPKLRRGGYMVFHDTSESIKPFTDYQRTGEDFDVDQYISVRKALKHIGLLESTVTRVGCKTWLKEYDTADPDDRAGGVIAFRKL